MILYDFHDFIWILGPRAGPGPPPPPHPLDLLKTFQRGTHIFGKMCDFRQISTVFVDFRDFGEIEKCKLFLKMAVFGSGLGPRAGDPGLGPGRAPGRPRAGPGRDPGGTRTLVFFSLKHRP